MVYVFLADGFEEMEAIAPIDLLRRASLDVTTVGVTGEYVSGAHGVVVKADACEATLDSSLEMIVLPGGSGGTAALGRSALVLKTIEYCVRTSTPIAAICAAPTILGKAGLLQDKNATCYPGLEDELLGAKVSDSSVCTDGIFTTGRSAGAALPFAMELVRVLKGEKAVKKLAASVVF